MTRRRIAKAAFIVVIWLINPGRRKEQAYVAEEVTISTERDDPRNHFLITVVLYERRQSESSSKQTQRTY